MSSVIYWSGGKESTATILYAYEHSIPIDNIVYCRTMFSHALNIPGDDPVFDDWIMNYAIPLLKNKYGYPITVLTSDRDYLDCFYHVVTQSKIPERNGKFSGFPIAKKCVCLRDLKLRPINKFQKSYRYDISYIGLNCDEHSRVMRLSSNKMSLLYDNNFSAIDCFSLCRSHDLLAPTYELFSRNGCWFCMNKPIHYFSWLRYNYPFYYDQLLSLSKVKNVVSPFFSYNKTFSDINNAVSCYNYQLSFWG